MQYGIHTYSRGATADPADLTSLARACERFGFNYFGINDHVVISDHIDSTYPYTEDGSWAGASDTDCLDVLSMLAFLAGTTERIRLLTSVMVIPHRPAVLTAKILATIDVLSRGRLCVGVGVGWMREEIEALAAQSYQRRGAVSDEYIEAWRCLWTEKVAAYEGEFVSFKGVMCDPKPVQKPGPPLWIGGEGPAARRRVARHGDGWYPVAGNPAHRLDTLERFSAGVNDVRRRAEANGRDPATINIALFVPWAALGEARMKDGERVLFTGPRDALLEDLAGFETAGLDVFVAGFGAQTAPDMIEQCQEFAEAIAMNLN
jgi:probable F420-dependent oxidoreductase